MARWVLVDIDIRYRVTRTKLGLAVSIIGFALQRDRAFTLISTIVLIVLLISFLLGKVE